MARGKQSHINVWIYSESTEGFICGNIGTPTLVENSIFILLLSVLVGNLNCCMEDATG